MREPRSQRRRRDPARAFPPPPSSATAKMFAAAIGFLLFREDAQASSSPTPTPSGWQISSEPSALWSAGWQASFAPTAAPSGSETCRNGVIGVENNAGEVCCPRSCGDFCGGAGCGDLGADDCCAGNIWGSGIYCGTAPCIIGRKTTAPATTPTVLSITPAPDADAAATTFLPSASSLRGGPAPGPTPSPTASGGAGGASPDAGQTPADALSTSSDEESGESILSVSVVGSFFFAVLVVTCARLRSHCSAYGKSIRKALETLIAKGSFWGANFVLFGLLITLNVYNFSSLWGATSVFISFVLWVVMFAWFVAFKTGTPATVSFECTCRICICRCKRLSSLPTEQPEPSRRPDLPQPVDSVGEAASLGDGDSANAGSESSREVPNPQAQKKKKKRRAVICMAIC